MNPLMFEGLLPDSRQVSSDAAERHAILTARTKHERAFGPLVLTTHVKPTAG